MKIDINDLLKNSFVISIDNSRIELMNKIFLRHLLKCPKVFNGFSNKSSQNLFAKYNVEKRIQKAGAYNCSLSHAAVIKMAKCLQLPFVCIFEDDAYPCNDIMQQFKIYLSNIPDDAQCIILGWSRKPNKTINYNAFFDKVIGDINGSHSYIIMASGYDNYLQTYVKDQYIPADCILPIMTQHKYTYCSKKCMFIQINLKKSMNNHLGYIYPNDNGIQNNSNIPPPTFDKISNILTDNVNDSVVVELNKIDNFIYRANGGNMGDMAIACAEFQLFDKYCFSYTTANRKNYKYLMSKPFNLVFGGGGGWVKYWNYSQALNDFLKNKNLKKCIILPSSFYECNDVINALDERFIVFCREMKSFDYCRSLNTKAKFILHDDMALSLDISKLNHNLKRNNIQTHNILQSYITVEKYLKSNTLHKIGNFFRNDKEKANINNKIPLDNFDLSTKLYMHGLDVTKNIAIRSTEVMLYAIQPYSIIRTDRLHVSLMSYLLNKNIEMYDNSYGKIKGVYELSLKSFQNVKFINI